MIPKSPRSLICIVFLSVCFLFYYQGRVNSISYQHASDAVHDIIKPPTATSSNEVATIPVQSPLQESTQEASTLKTYEGIGAEDNSLPENYAPSPVDKVGAYNSALAAIDATRPQATTSQASIGYQTETSSPSPEPTKDAAQVALEAEESAHEALLWSNTSYPFHTSDRIALIVEDRPLANLVPLILHFATVLGPTWPIILYTKDNTTLFPSTPFNHLIQTGQIHHRQLPDFIHFSSHSSVSTFMTKPWLWNQLAPAKHILIFQTDSIICSKAPQTVDDFLAYDFVGAPIAPGFGHGYNGGLSLRNRDMMLDIIHANSFSTETGVPEVSFEDQWYYTMIKALPDREDGKPGANLPSEDVAKTFAVETIFYEKPLGYHQVGRWQESNMAAIVEWCPEVKLCLEELLVLGGLTPEKEELKHAKEELEHAKEELEHAKEELAKEQEKDNLEALMVGGEAKIEGAA